MKPIYTNRSFLWRMNVSAVVVVIAFLFGIWELWNAMQPGPEGPGYGFMFALLFIGGGYYGMRQLIKDYAGTVVRLEADSDADKAVVHIWRPFRSRRIAGRLSDLSNWRFEMQPWRKSMKLPLVLADHPTLPHPLRFEGGKGAVIGEELRALAPEAVDALERYSAPGAR